MASPKELIEIVSKTMGVPVETVTVIDRWLADAGLRTRALRGRGNTSMTYQDAANLIIATALDANPKDAVRLVSEYGSLPATHVHPAIDRGATFLGETFGVALAEMIDTVAVERDAFSAPEDAREHMSADVSLFGPRQRAEIILRRNKTDYTFSFGASREALGDLRRCVQFSQVTLGFVGEAIADGLAK